MQRTGAATLPLHSGRAPRWLFDRMVRLARGVLAVMSEDPGPSETLKRLSDPFWFQALGCLMGFDWHSSGLTTTVCGALKEAATRAEHNFGIAIAGGKGRASRRTPDELRRHGERFGFDAERLVYTSRLVAKVDNNALQDGYTLYHHCFLVTATGEWAVVQQGMRESDATARRYHWLGAEVDDFVCEPHKAICSDDWDDRAAGTRGRAAGTRGRATKGEEAGTEPRDAGGSGPAGGSSFERAKRLNLVAAESEAARAAMTELSWSHPENLVAELRRHLELPRRHHLAWDDIDPDRLRTTFAKAYEAHAKDFQELLGLEGVGAKTLRALALLSELLAGAPPSWRDPARYSFAHGGKDGHPYPVDRKTYDSTIEILERAVRAAKLGRRESLEALRRLHKLTRLFGVG